MENSLENLTELCICRGHTNGFISINLVCSCFETSFLLPQLSSLPEEHLRPHLNDSNIPAVSDGDWSEVASL